MAREPWDKGLRGIQNAFKDSPYPITGFSFFFDNLKSIHYFPSKVYFLKAYKISYLMNYI